MNRTLGRGKYADENAAKEVGEVLWGRSLMNPYLWQTCS